MKAVYFRKWSSLIFLFGMAMVVVTLSVFNFNLGREESKWDGWEEEDEEQGREGQVVEVCGCKRKFFYEPPGWGNGTRKRLNSSCSDEGSFYEEGQRVVSFTLYLRFTNFEQLYLEGIRENLRRMKEFYPGSSMRLYTDVNLERGSEFCRLLCENPELHWCDVRRTPSFGDQSSMYFRTWRFLPLGDPTVEYFLSRDLDSVIIERQVAAVKEWLYSSKPFHIMRDHPQHAGTPIMAGLWGARNSLLGMKEAVRLRDMIMHKARVCLERRYDDQQILEVVIFDLKYKSILAFDSYSCKKRFSWGLKTAVRPFSVRRKDNISDFAGNVDLGKAKYGLTKCPVECRPRYGKDWEYC